MNKYLKLVISILKSFISISYTLFKFFGLKLALIILALLFIFGLINRNTYLIITLAFSSYTVLEILKELNIKNGL